MANQIILTVPEDISAYARRIATTTAQPVEQVLLEHLKTLSASVSLLSSEEQAELDALQHLSDDALWTIAREQMPDPAQTRARELMDKNSRRIISAAEEAELAQLVERADRLMLRKAEAATILKKRGQLFTQKDFQLPHE